VLNIEKFENWCKESWGTETRDEKKLFAGNTKQIRDNIDFSTTTNEVKLRIAEKLILESCSHVGSYASSGDDVWYIYNFAKELFNNYIGFNDRRTEPLKAALYLLSHIDYGRTSPDKRSDFDHICAGGGAMVAMYLMAHSEYLFRVQGRYLNENGSTRVKLPKQLINKASIRTSQKRINNIDQAFTIYLYRNQTILGKRLIMLDKKIGITVRLKRIRNPVMHGELADASSEAMFFGLMTAMFYYGSKLQKQ
jgi:hypothetical protein